MLGARITLSYGEKRFTFSQESEKTLRGRLSCDCMKSKLIRENCDPEFPVLRCGNQIVVVSLVHLEDESAGSRLQPRKPMTNAAAGSDGSAR